MTGDLRSGQARSGQTRGQRRGRPARFGGARSRRLRDDHSRSRRRDRPALTGLPSVSVYKRPRCRVGRNLPCGRPPSPEGNRRWSGITSRGDPHRIRRRFRLAALCPLRGPGHGSHIDESGRRHEARGGSNVRRDLRSILGRTDGPLCRFELRQRRRLLDRRVRDRIGRGHFVRCLDGRERMRRSGIDGGHMNVGHRSRRRSSRRGLDAWVGHARGGGFLAQRRRLVRGAHGRRRARREERLRIHVPLLVDGDANAEMQIWLGELQIAARTDRSDRGTLDDDLALLHDDRAEMQERDRVPVRGADGHRLPALRNRAGERDGPASGCLHCSAGLAGDVDATVLPTGIRIVTEDERAKHRAVGRPRPRPGLGRDDTHHENRDQNGDEGTNPHMHTRCSRSRQHQDGSAP